MNVYVAYAGNLLSKNQMKVIGICTTREIALHLCSKHAADRFFPLSEVQEQMLNETGVCGDYAINSVPLDTCF
jgi:hypothetical protein